jgi:adhesin transport system outer membrane protein
VYLALKICIRLPCVAAFMPGVALALTLGCGPPLRAQIAIPAPSDRPQAIAAGTDGFLVSLGAHAATAEFVARLSAAAARLPVLGERAADVAAARAQRDQARSRLFPGLGVDLVASRTIDRDLQSPSTQVELLAPRSRNDAIGSIDQLLTDFGATSARIRAGNASADAARAELDAARNGALLQLASTWYQVLSAQTSLALATSNVVRMRELAQGAALRFESGIDSGGEVARARSYLAAAQSQSIDFERQRRGAEARYVELFGIEPGTLARPDARLGDGTAASERPELVAARAELAASRAAVTAARSDRLPRLSARLTSSAFNVLRSSDVPYDIRGLVTLSQRFSTGGAEAARVAELSARQQAAGLATQRIAAATTREASSAEADVEGFARALPALEASYLDSRRARDLFAEQFRVSRGTLFDVLQAERDLLDAALMLARSQYELDLARLTLLARRGGMIEAFGLTPAVAGNDKVMGARP